MNKAVFRTLPVQGAVQIKVMPHLSNLEAAIIFIGGIGCGILYSAWKYGKSIKEEENE